jgi:tetratricopeptide (TPR) repeat protein
MQARVAASFGHRFGHAHDLLERALEHAGAAADERRSRRILLTLTTTAFWGPMHADEAIKRCEEILDQTRGDRRAEAGTLVRLAGLRAMRGDFDRARSELLEARALLEEMNLAYLVARTCDFAGLIELLAGDPPAAEHEFRAGFDDLERMGERGFLATSAALLARALLEQGRLDEAERFITRSEHEAAPDDGISQVRWRSLRGRTLAAVGRFDEAERCGRRAVEIGDSSDELLGHADALIDLAEVLRASGRDVDAVPLVVTALDLYEQKGVTPYVDRARALLETLPAREPQPDAAR